MNSKSLLLELVCGACLTSALIGCGQSQPRVEVVGEVMLNGEPVSVAQVYLSPKSAGLEKAGVFSASVVDGAFEIPQTEGPPPGEYEVLVQPAEEDSEDIAEQLIKHKGKTLAEREQFRSAVARKGPIRVELSADDVNEVSIQLTTR